MNTIYIFIGVILAIAFKIGNDFDFFKLYSITNTYADCKYLNLDILGPEDITHYKNNILLVGSGNFAKVFAQGTPSLEQQGIYAILDSHKNYKVQKLEIVDFPKDVSLYIHGINYIEHEDGDYLYVINHGFNNGGERIEIFKIEQNLTLTHKHSILMDKKYMGVLNDLIVVSKNRLLTTKYMPYADPINGRKQTEISQKLKSIFIQVTKQKETMVIDCKFERKGKIIEPQCLELPTTFSVMANGITWDGKDRVWVADTVLKGINEYKLIDNGLQFMRFINIQFGIDNIEYEKETDSLIIGLIPKLYNFFTLSSYLEKNNTLGRQTEFDYLSGIGQYDLQKNQLNELVMNKYLSKGTSGGVLSGQNLFISSWCDVSVMVCRKI